MSRMLSPEGVEALRKMIEASVTVSEDGSIAASQETLMDMLAEAGVVLLPIEPTPGLLASMAMRGDHALFAPAQPDSAFFPRTEQQRARSIEVALTSMRQLHEEVVGTGFYKPEREEGYVGLSLDQAVDRLKIT